MILRHFWDSILIEAWDIFPLKASLPRDLQSNALLLCYLKCKSNRFWIHESKVVFLTPEHFLSAFPTFLCKSDCGQLLSSFSLRGQPASNLQISSARQKGSDDECSVGTVVDYKQRGSYWEVRGKKLFHSHLLLPLFVHVILVASQSTVWSGLPSAS